MGVISFFSFQINSVYVLVNKNNKHSPFSYKNIHPNRNISTRTAQLFCCGYSFLISLYWPLQWGHLPFWLEEENIKENIYNYELRQHGPWILTNSDN